MTKRILVVDDEIQMGAAMTQVLERSGHDVDTVTNASDALSQISSVEYDAVVSDLRMPGMSGQELVQRVRALHPATPVIVVTAYGTVESAVSCVRDGAANYLLKPFSPEALERAVAEALERRAVEAAPEGSDDLVAEDPLSLRTVELALRAAAVDATVLLEAESGAGKEVFARLIHRESRRRDGPFVAINCAALPKELLEAELFGHSKGAFTGALRDRKGQFRAADGGTLLLDEIGEMSADLQSRLLRVLQDCVIRPVGSESSVRVDVRVVAATNRNLRREVAEGRFREDLYYRLRVFPLRIPPLRERRADIEPLVRRSATRYRGPGARITPRALARLREHCWPGNVRELENVVQRAGILAGDDAIDVGHLDLEPSPRPREAVPPACLSLEDAERETIRRALEDNRGNRTEAAAALGISPRTLRHKLKRFRDAGLPVLETT